MWSASAALGAAQWTAREAVPVDDAATTGVASPMDVGGGGETGGGDTGGGETGGGGDTGGGEIGGGELDGGEVVVLLTSIKFTLTLPVAAAPIPSVSLPLATFTVSDLLAKAFAASDS